MSKQLNSFKITKKRSFSDMPRRTLSNNWNENKSHTNFPSLAQTQTQPFHQLTSRQQKLLDRGFLFKQLADQKGQNEGLRKSIKEALDKVKLERRQSYVAKDQLFIVNEDKMKLEKDNKHTVQQYNELAQKYNSLVQNLEASESEKNEAQRELREIKSKLGNDLKAVDEELKTLRQDNERLSEIARDEGLAGQRIKVLEIQLRKIKMDKMNYEDTIVKLGNEVKEYLEIIQSTKPEMERQAERIKYYERLASDLQKKAEQFYQKEYELHRELNKKEKQISQVSASNDFYKKKYEAEEQKLKTSLGELKVKAETLKETEQRLAHLTQKHQQQITSNQNLTAKVEELQIVVTNKAQEISKHVTHIDFLQSHQNSMKNAIQQAKFIAAQSNKFVQKRDMQAYKLKQDKEYLQKKIDEIVQRYRKFDQYYLECSASSKNKLKDSVVTYVKSCSKIEIDMNELKKSLDAKDLEFMEERQMFQKDLEAKQQSLPVDPSLYENIFREKNEEIRVLEYSNAQLMKSSAGFQDIVNTLEEQNARYEIDIKDLNRNIIELRKLQKQNTELKGKQRQQQLTIEQLKKQHRQLDERLIRKSEQLSTSNDRILVLQKEISKLLTEIDALQIRLNMKSPLKEVQIEKPPPTNEELERNLTLQMKQKQMIEAIQKMQNALKSIHIFFSCGFCDKTVNQPYTVTPCGHNYCQECREGFADDCYQCSNNMPIHGVFKNTFLENTLPRLQFFNMVFENVSKLFIKQNKK